ncbi:MAG: hypothetical protein HC895_02840 [Leptolyngbyaceae cyanobacterium SM1_3_5]|nr:hypothetical protein [Leptolyngbyaceae cyanobacterium SM1_3_5]
MGTEECRGRPHPPAATTASMHNEAASLQQQDGQRIQSKLAFLSWV